MRSWLLSADKKASEFLYNLGGEEFGLVTILVGLINRFAVWILILGFTFFILSRSNGRFFIVLKSGLALLLAAGFFAPILNFFIKKPGLAGTPFVPLAMVVVVVFSGLLWEFKAKRVALWFILISIFIAFSQINAGFHYLLDILIAAAVGILSVLIVSLLVPFSLQKRNGPVV